jgi:peptidoglycan/LPS O-acetylase OafA/YrhL
VTTEIRAEDGLVPAGPGTTNTAQALLPSQRETPDPAAAASAPAAKPRSAGRLRWLDALRGIAALAVVYEHFGTYMLPDVKHFTVQWVHAGTFGVMLFFLVSGYIVPASIERRGSVRDFWIGRVFRLYPAYLLTIVAGVLVAKVGPGTLPPEFDGQRSTSLLAHMTMLHEVIGVDNIQNQFWTLAYEMCFYLVVTVVFVFGMHRFSAEIAVLLAGAAAALGGLMPSRLLAGDGLSLRNLTVVTALVLVAGIVAVSTRRRAVVVAGAVLLGVFVLSLLGVNQRSGAWEGFIILAVMFTGTAIYRAESGQISRVRAVIAVVTVLAAAVVAVFVTGNMWHLADADTFPAERSWLGGVVLAMAFFGIGMLVRRRPIPTWLSWLGAISYSVYLLHYALIYAFLEPIRSLEDNPIAQRLAFTALYFTVLLVASWLCYRFVELPFQGLGRRVIKRMRTA